MLVKNKKISKKLKLKTFNIGFDCILRSANHALFWFYCNCFIRDIIHQEHKLHPEISVQTLGFIMLIM